MLTIREMAADVKIEDTDAMVSARINNEGYWCTFRWQGGLYRRCIDGTVVKGAKAEKVSDEQVVALHKAFIKWVQALESNNAVVALSQQRSIDDYRRLVFLYKKAYQEPVMILPPDRYGDVVLLPALGCPNRRCTFCAFYKDKPYQVMTEESFVHHIKGVMQLMPGRTMLPTGVFLGSANALALSQRRLVAHLATVHQYFLLNSREISSFMDADVCVARSNDEWQALRGLGLQQVVIGLETGCGTLRAQLGKSGDLSAVRNSVESLKATNIKVSLTVLAGVGGDAHIEQTTSFIRQLQLDDSDRIYLSPLESEFSDSIFAQHQQQVLRQSLDTPAKVASYHMERFNYFS